MQPHANPTFLALLLFLTAAAIAITLPHSTNALSSRKSHSDVLPQPPKILSYKRNHPIRIKYLPAGYVGRFITFISISPKFPSAETFIHFFTTAAALSATDPLPGRHHQRFRMGALALEMEAVRAGELVSREFVQAASLWLADAAVKGWTGFFRAWVVDVLDGQMVEITMGRYGTCQRLIGWGLSLERLGWNGQGILGALHINCFSNFGVRRFETSSNCCV